MEPGALDEADLAELHRLASASARKAGAGDDAADVAQEALIKLDAHGPFEDLEHIKAWVQRTSKNATIDLHRRRKHIAGEMKDDDRPPLSFTSDLVAKKKINDLIDALPLKYERVIRLTYVDGLPAGEVGDLLGYTPATVHKMLSEARSMLRPDLTAPPGYVQ